MAGSRFVVCVSLSLALAVGLAGDAWAVTYGPAVKATGPEETVFHYTTDHCSNDEWDIPDQPARAFKDDQNRVHLHFDIATNTVYRNIGTSLDDASKSVDAGQGSRHDCANPVTISGGNPDPSKFDDYEWLTSMYTLDGHTIYSIAHEEWRGWQAPQPYYCPLPANNDTTKCWYNGLVLYASTNSGDWFDRYWRTNPECCPPPSHLVASVPYNWVNGTGPYGVFQPSNIIRKQPDDGYLYAMIRAKEPGKGDVSCLMRTQATVAALGDPTSWRAWGDGPDADSTDSFEVQFINPYTFTPSDPSKYMCKAIAPSMIAAASESLTYNTYFGKYLLIGVWGEPTPGFYYSLSDDLINWSPAQTLLERETQYSYQCGDADPVIAPSLLDPNSPTRNFETTGRDAYIYYALFHPANCQFGPNRDLRRVPIRFSKVPTASFTVSPSPAPTNQTVTFNGSASTDSDGTISKYELDFDGNGSYDATTTTATTTHTYTAAGTMAVKLRVTDNDGAWNETIRNLTVQGSLPNPLPTPVPAPTPAPVQTQTPTTPPQTTAQSSCLQLRRQRIARLTRQLKSARRKLARAHTRAAKRVYRAKVKSLTKRLKRLRARTC